MRNVAICGDKVSSLMPEPSYITSVKMDSVPVLCGLIHTEDPIFEPHHPANVAKVFVKIRAFSCNYRDKAIILNTATQAPAHRFNTIGSEFVAEVIAIGAEVTEFQVGDRVIPNNAYPDSGVKGVLAGVATNHSSKEYQIFHQAKLLKIPQQLSDEVAAAFSIGAQTTYSMIRKLQILEGANVLVTAAKSNTSLFAIQALKSYNVNLYVTSTSRRFEQNLLEMGVKQLIQIHPESENWIDPEVAQEIQAQTSGFDCILDPFFDLHVGKLIPALKPGGRYITCGLYDQYSQYTNQPFEYKGLSTKDLLITVMLNNIQIIGNCIGLKEDLETAIVDYAAGKFEVVIDSVFTGSQIAEFLDRTFSSSDRFGKVIYQYD